MRSAASNTPGNITGNVVLSSVGLTDKKIVVSGDVNALPTINQVADQSFNNASATTAINFTGTAITYTWTNDMPGSGLPSNGSGDIPSFTAINTGQSVLTATITVMPSDASCSGNAITFKININPTPIPSLTAGMASGNITACQGSSSASPDVQQFSVSGKDLTGDVQMAAPANFEISLGATGGYANTLSLTQKAGKVNSTIIYVRSLASAPVGNISGNVTISSAGAPNQMVGVSGVVNALPTVNQISDQNFNNASATTAIKFTGTAIIYTWTNDIPGIGLPGSGSGDIPSFMASNTGLSAITATITITPSNGVCAGSPVVFKIIVKPTPPAITLAGNLPSLNTVYGTPSTAVSFSVSGDNLLSAVMVTPPAGFEVSTDGVDFKNTTTIGGPGTFNATTVYVRLAKTTFAGNYSGNIILTTNGTTSNLTIPASVVTPAKIIVTADNKIRSFYTENPPLTITYRGFVNGENESSLVKKPEAGTMATMISAAGDYAIYFTTPAESPNYSFAYIPGVLTITPAGIVIVNAFSPNDDGTNDTWAIKQIEYYPNCTVDVFNRWGAKVFSSIGYPKQWNGQSSGTPVPNGTYYYMINLRDGSAVKSGWVAIIR